MNKEILEVDAEEISNEAVIDSVAKIINNKLVALDKFEFRLAELRGKYSGIKIIDANDRAGYDAAKKAKAEIKDLWVGSDKDREVAKRPYMDASKKLEEKFQWVIGELHAIAAPIEERIKWYESEKKRKDEEEAKMKNERLSQRVLALLAMGAINDGVKVTLDSYSADLSLIRDTNEDIYKAKVYIRFHEIYEAREKVRKANLEAEELRLQLEKEEKQKFELEKKKLAEDKKRLDDQLAEAERAKEKLKKELVAARSKELYALGLSFIYADNEWALGGISISHAKLGTLDETEWKETIEKITPQIDVEKAAIEEAGRVAMQKIKDEAIAEAERKRKLAEQKAEEDRRKLASEATDKAKYKDLYDYLKKAPVYEFESGHFKAKYKVIRDFLADLK